MICNLFTEPIYFIFSYDVPSLLYYSHIPTAILAFLIGLFVFLKGKHLLINRLLFAISICFSLWVFSNLILWTNIHSDFMMFIWSFLRIYSSLLSILCVYFIYVFLEDKDVSLKIKSLFLLLIIPVILLSPTNINISGFNITNCDAFMFESSIFQFFRVFFGVLSILWILVLLIRKYRKSESTFKKQILLIGTGIELFLFLFFVVTFLAAYLTNIGILKDSRIEYYGLFGMVIFVIYLSILIVKFKSFNIKLIATQAIIWGLVALIGAQFFFIQQPINYVINGVTFIGVIILGSYLIKSVKREIDQRERLEKLRLKLEKTNIDLEVANDKLKGLDKLKTEFLSLASHQLRSPLTAIKGYASMLKEGDFGDLNDQAKETISRILSSSQNLTKVVEDLLNVTKIEQGGMQYEMEDFNISDLINEVKNEQSITAEHKGLKLIYNYQSDIEYKIKGDKDKLRQVVMNLIDNSIKYTRNGEIKIILSKDNSKVRIAINDTGIGMTDKIIESLFEKFARSEDGMQENASGSGLGLYLAKQIVLAHKGSIWAESEGKDKGSTFIIELEESK